MQMLSDSGWNGDHSHFGLQNTFSEQVLRAAKLMEPVDLLGFAFPW